MNLKTRAVIEILCLSEGVALDRLVHLGGELSGNDAFDTDEPMLGRPPAGDVE